MAIQNIKNKYLRRTALVMGYVVGFPLIWILETVFSMLVAAGRAALECFNDGLDVIRESYCVKGFKLIWHGEKDAN